MLTRRQLLTRGTTVLLLVPIAGCMSGGSSPSTPPPGPACSGTDVLSSSDASHTHTVCVLNTDMTSPPAAGVTYTTSSDGGHTHQVTLSMANLAALAGGQTIMVTSTNDVDPVNGTAHTHKFAITKGNNTGTGGGGGGSDPGGGW
jgi:hypothetical protein